MNAPYPLPDGWEWVKVGDVSDVNPENVDSSYGHETILYFDISSIGTGNVINPPLKIKLADAPSRARRIIRKNDIAISTVRPNRRSFIFFNNPLPETIVSTGFAVIRAKRETSPRYLYYVVAQHSFTDYLTSRAEGSAYPAVNPQHISDCLIPLPPLPVQRRIAHILGSFDEQIEALRQQNATLEATARALFEEWFVRFRYPGHEGVPLVA